MKLLLSSLLLLSLAACVNLDTTTKNAQGNTYRCFARGGGIIGSSLAQSAYDDCMKRAEEKGFRPQ